MNKSALLKRRKELDAKKPVVLTNLPTIERRFQSLTDGLAIIATENPIEHLHPKTGQPIPQVLEMAGCELRPGVHAIPIVDNHDLKSVHSVFGSIADVQISNGQFLGRPVFATDEESQKIATRYQEGHLTDFSITAQPIEAIELTAGKTYTTPDGSLVQGPAIIVTRWRPINAALTAWGADDHSYVKRSFADQRSNVMDPSLMAKLSAMGLPEGMSDPAEILTWLMTKMEMEPVEPVDAPVENMMGEEKAMPPVEQMAMPAEEAKPVVENGYGMDKMERSKQAIEAEITKRVLAADQARRKEIHAAVQLAKIERSFADELCDSNVSVSDARKRIIERMANQPSGTSVGADVRVVGDGSERLYQALGDGLIMRSLQASRATKMPELSKDASDFARMPMKRVAELLLRSNGINTDRMSDVSIAKIAMGSRAEMRANRIERAYHTTGSFANLLLDAANKSLLAAYEEAPQTWNLWARQAPSVADFKNINRIRFSESPDPEMVPERAEYKEKAMSDSKETYKVEKYGALFTVSWETVVNDDLDAISRVPAMHGNACRRKVNREVYSVLTSNPTMGDGVALFGSHASGTNLSGASANPGVATLNTSYAAMRIQKGLTSDAILNIVPRFLIVPAALEATALELVNSTSYIVANGNQGVQNIYGVGGVRSLTVIGEPVLDGNSTTAWYLAADTTQVDTVEVSFLQGEESPVLEDEWDFDKDVYKYKVRQTFGVKAIDWRGLYKYAVS